MALSACGGNDDVVENININININIKPSYLSAVATANYDGNTDDLLTAGLGKTGLGAATSVALTPVPLEADGGRIAQACHFQQLPRHS